MVPAGILPELCFSKLLLESCDRTVNSVSEDRRQKTEDRRQKTEDRRQIYRILNKGINNG